MKVCILSVVSLRHMSVASVYYEYFKRNNINYDIVYADKYGIDEDSEADTVYRYKLQNVKSGGLSKVKNYLRFKKYAKRIINNNAYDLLIVWGEVTQLLFFDYIHNNWKNKYVLNIRDLCHFRINDFVISKTLKDSLFYTVPNEKMQEIYGNYNKAVVFHSVNKSIIEKALQHEITHNNPIRIAFMGNIRQYEASIFLIDALCNDERYEVHFYGPHDDYLKKYVSKNNISNVVFHGVFQTEDTIEILNNTDIIHNLYHQPNGKHDWLSRNGDNALTIKFYYSIGLHIPILCNIGTYSNEVGTKIGIAFSVSSDDKETMADSLFEWYINLDEETVYKNCDIFYKMAEDSRNGIYSLIDNYRDGINI